MLHLLIQAHVLVAHRQEHQVPVSVEPVQACAETSTLGQHATERLRSLLHAEWVTRLNPTVKLMQACLMAPI